MPQARPSAPAATSSRWRPRGAGGDDVTATAHVIHDGIRTFALSDKPIVAAVQGAVAGGGLGLMLTADYIVAADTAKFVSKYANIGLTPDLGVSTLLPAAIGQRRALQLLLQDRTLSAAEALDWGLVAEVRAARRGRRPRRGRSRGSGSRTRPRAFGQAKRLVRVGARPLVRRQPRRRGGVDRRALRHRRVEGARRGLRRGIRQSRSDPPPEPCPELDRLSAAPAEIGHAIRTDRGPTHTTGRTPMTDSTSPARRS